MDTLNISFETHLVLVGTSKNSPYGIIYKKVFNQFKSVEFIEKENLKNIAISKKQNLLFDCYF